MSSDHPDDDPVDTGSMVIPSTEVPPGQEAKASDAGTEKEEDHDE